VKLLLDTHALVWWLQASPRLSNLARQLIISDESQVCVSIASAWEMAIKVGSGKWDDARDLLEEFEKAVADEGFDLLQIEIAHVRAAGLMNSPHRDPFDRLLAAQASIEGLTLMTADPKLAGLGAPVLW
jgi:PIN domain nuclease of toxin-antitoxin system